MITIQARAFGTICEQREQKEFSLVLAMVDACVNNDRAGVADIMTWFQAEYITDPYYRAIFNRLLAVQAGGEPMVAYVVAKGLRGCGHEYGKTIRDIANLVADCTNQRAHIRYYAADVYQEHRRTHAAADIAGAADQMIGADDPDAVLEQLPEIASKYAPLPMNRTADTGQVFQDIIAEMEGKKPSGVFRFGITVLDNLIGGLPAGALVTVGARTSNGKSVFLGQSAIRCADRDRKVALFFSLEMGKAELFKRWAALLSRQPIKGGDRRQFLGGLSRVERLANDQLLHVFTGPRTVEQIAAEALAYTTRCEVALICVDYLQALVATRSRDGREQQVAHQAAALKHLASQTGVPVLTASQLNKDGKDCPRLSAIRESEAIANYSNIVILLSPRSTSGDAVTMDINLAKYRDGATDLLVATWDRSLFTIRDQDACDHPNYDPALSCITESDLPDIINESRRKQPKWE